MKNARKAELINYIKDDFFNLIEVKEFDYFLTRNKLDDIILKIAKNEEDKAYILKNYIKIIKEADSLHYILNLNAERKSRLDALFAEMVAEEAEVAEETEVAEEVEEVEEAEEAEVAEVAEDVEEIEKNNPFSYNFYKMSGEEKERILYKLTREINKKIILDGFLASKNNFKDVIFVNNIIEKLAVNSVQEQFMFVNFNKIAKNLLKMYEEDSEIILIDNKTNVLKIILKTILCIIRLAYFNYTFYNCNVVKSFKAFLILDANNSVKFYTVIFF